MILQATSYDLHHKAHVDCGHAAMVDAGEGDAEAGREELVDDLGD